MTIKITGAAEVARNLRKVADQASALEGGITYTLEEMFPPAFMKRFTDFSTIDAMFRASGFKLDSADDLKNIPDAEWDAYVLRKTKFGNWAEMQKQATAEFVGRKLGMR